MDRWHDQVFGPGYCKCCRLLKPLAMIEIPGLHEDKDGELTGGMLILDPHARRGYCYDCAPDAIERMTRKDA